MSVLTPRQSAIQSLEVSFNNTKNLAEILTIFQRKNLVKLHCSCVESVCIRHIGFSMTVKANFQIFGTQLKLNNPFIQSKTVHNHSLILNEEITSYSYFNNFMIVDFFNKMHTSPNKVAFLYLSRSHDTMLSTDWFKT